MEKELNRIRRDVSYEQLIGFLKVMSGLPLLYREISRNNSTLKVKGYWKIGAYMLNAIRGGTFKNSEGWLKYLNYWRYRVKQRITEIIMEMESSIVPEDDFIPVSELDRLILNILDAEEAEQYTRFEFNPGAAKITDFSENNLESPKSARVLKRRHSVAEIAVVDPKKLSTPGFDEKNRNDEAGTSAQPPRKSRRLASAKARIAINKYYNKPPKKNASGRVVRGRKRRRDSDSDDLVFKAPAIRRHRSHSFTDMGDALEFDRKMRLKLHADKTRTDPESVRKREADRVENRRIISQTLWGTASDCLHILVFTTTVSEIIDNNPIFQRTMTYIPTIS